MSKILLNCRFFKTEASKRDMMSERTLINIDNNTRVSFDLWYVYLKFRNRKTCVLGRRE